MGSDQRASSRGREQITIAIETDTRHPPETRADLKVQMVGSCGKVRGGYSRVITAELGTCRHCTGDSGLGSNSEYFTLEINIQTLGLHSSTIRVAAAPLPSQC